MKSDKINISEGGGGEAMYKLISECVFKNLKNRKTTDGIGLDEMDDGAAIKINGANIIFTTDSYVVKPVFFNGGDIGKLAVNGTLNDLCVMGAKPIALSLSLIITEGFPKEDLEKIIKSINEVSEALNVPIVTGDTKIIDGRETGIIINTSGIGIADKVIRDCNLKPGDLILINGNIAEHGIAVLSNREGIEFETEVKSDTNQLCTLIHDLLDNGVDIHSAKDPTRGGIASALNEMASKSGVTVVVYEDKIPLSEAVRTACEMLGIDPFEVANEGKVLMGVPEKDADKALEIMRKYDSSASIIGKVVEKEKADVILETSIRSKRILRMPLGDPVPRVC